MRKGYHYSREAFLERGYARLRLRGKVVLKGEKGEFYLHLLEGCMVVHISRTSDYEILLVIILVSEHHQENRSYHSLLLSHICCKISRKQGVELGGEL